MNHLVFKKAKSHFGYIDSGLFFEQLVGKEIVIQLCAKLQQS